MKINTLFPSKKSSEGAKGGIVLLKLEQNSESVDNSPMYLSAFYLYILLWVFFLMHYIKLEVTFKDRNNKPFAESQLVDITKFSNPTKGHKEVTTNSEITHESAKNIENNVDNNNNNENKPAIEELYTNSGIRKAVVLSRYVAYHHLNVA